MTVDDWVYEAVEQAKKNGATLRDIQRFIDEQRFEELAIDTIEAALDKLEREGRIEHRDGRWFRVRGTSTQDALKRLFGDAPDDEENT